MPLCHKTAVLISDFCGRLSGLATVEEVVDVLADAINQLDGVSAIVSKNDDGGDSAALPISSKRYLLNDQIALLVDCKASADQASVQTFVELYVSLASDAIVTLDLRLANETYLHVMDSTQDGIWDWDAAMNQVAFSKRWKEMLGYAENEIEDDFSSWVTLLHPDDQAGALARADNFFANPRDEYNSTFRLRCKDGAYKWIMARGKVVEWLDAQTPKRIIGTHVDIEKQKVLEQSLSETAKHLEQEQELLTRSSEMASIGSWRVNLTNDTIWWSDKTRAIHGVDKDYVPKLGEAINFYKEGWSRELIKERFSECVKAGGSFDEEAIIINQEGEEKWVRALGVKSDEGDQEVVYGLFQDISDRVETIRALEQATLAAEQASRVKGDFLASVSHEIRTPMNGVLGMLKQLRKSELTERQCYQLDLAMSSAESLLKLINDLLDLSKIESDKIVLDNIEVELEKFFDEFANGIVFRAQEKNIDLLIDMTPLRLERAKVDPHRLRQIMTNIVGNAIKFTETGYVRISVMSGPVNETGESVLTCEIADTGAGIAEDRLDSIFEQFTQEDASTTRKFGGTGLGLTIAKKLCMLMGGNISARSMIGEGSTFLFSVKLSDSVEKKKSDLQSLSQCSILVLEDNDKQYEIISRYFMVNGANVERARDGAEAAAIVAELQQNNACLDLILIDDQLIDKDVITLRHDIRSLQGWQATKIIYITMMVERSSVSSTKLKQTDAIVTKPFTVIDINQIAQMISESEEAQSIEHAEMDHAPDEVPEDFKLHGKHLLVAEDNFINQQVIEGILEEFECEITIVSTGVEAVDTLTGIEDASLIDLVLMDCQMPEMDGYTATRLIRSGEAGQQWQKIPVIAMTANAMVGDRDRCLRAGMNDYLTKPVEMDKLISVLGSYIKAS